jgi:YD repeat-containing protein
VVSATFDTSKKQLTELIKSASGALCTTAVFNYASIADFVDEVRVIPGVTLAVSNTQTNSAACGSGSGTVTFSYDSMRRLTGFSNPGGTTTYTAWDSSGRPTAGVTSTGTTISTVYDDMARALTQTLTTAAGVKTVSVQSFDANGNQTTVVELDASGVPKSTLTYNIMSTAQVCK